MQLEVAQDHPHACGDKKISVRQQLTFIGSSPRVWGQGFNGSYAHRITRIIPTRVGTSCRTARCRYFRRDHPHACGDKVVSSSYSIFNIGSSPRVWGQVNHYINGTWDLRIIPTRVGTRSKVIEANGTAEDHPHACGDKPHLSSVSGFRRGSSPRVWGQGTG